MSLSWQNRRHGQSLVANGKSKVNKIKRLQQKKVIKLRLKEPTYGELWIVRGIAFWICGTA